MGEMIGLNFEVGVGGYWEAFEWWGVEDIAKRSREYYITKKGMQVKMTKRKTVLEDDEHIRKLDTVFILWKWHPVGGK